MDTTAAVPQPTLLEPGGESCELLLIRHGRSADVVPGSDEAADPGLTRTAAGRWRRWPPGWPRRRSTPYTRRTCAGRSRPATALAAHAASRCRPTPTSKRSSSATGAGRVPPGRGGTQSGWRVYTRAGTASPGARDDGACSALRDSRPSTASPNATRVDDGGRRPRWRHQRVPGGGVRRAPQPVAHGGEHEHTVVRMAVFGGEVAHHVVVANDANTSTRYSGRAGPSPRPTGSASGR